MKTYENLRLLVIDCVVKDCAAINAWLIVNGPADLDQIWMAMRDRLTVLDKDSIPPALTATAIQHQSITVDNGVYTGHFDKLFGGARAC